jgi:hypothetical protein
MDWFLSGKPVLARELMLGGLRSVQATFDD